MRICLQRVNSASVAIGDELAGEIGPGLVLLVGFRTGDAEDQIEPMARRIVNLRIFEDDDGRMNESLLERGYSLLVISQFTLYADVAKGRRPSFTEALEPRRAEEFYLRLVSAFRSMNVRTETGRFGAKMLVRINNWGPVTLVLDA
jgi:D-tyrosyl-tRNA(Tyr) deacylase